MACNDGRSGGACQEGQQGCYRDGWNCYRVTAQRDVQSWARGQQDGKLASFRVHLTRRNNLGRHGGFRMHLNSLDAWYVFQVTWWSVQVILAHISGRIRKNYIKILPGDKVASHAPACFPRHNFPAHAPARSFHIVFYTLTLYPNVPSIPTRTWVNLATTRRVCRWLASSRPMILQRAGSPSVSSKLKAQTASLSDSGAQIGGTELVMAPTNSCIWGQSCRKSHSTGGQAPQGEAMDLNRQQIGCDSVKLLCVALSVCAMKPCSNLECWFFFLLSDAMHAGKFWLEQSCEIYTSWRGRGSGKRHYFWNNVLAARQTCNLKRQTQKKNVLVNQQEEECVCQYDVSYFCVCFWCFFFVELVVLYRRACCPCGCLQSGMLKWRVVTTISLCACVHAALCMAVCAYVCAYIYIYIYIHTYTHTHTHIYIYIYILWLCKHCKKYCDTHVLSTIDVCTFVILSRR